MKSSTHSFDVLQTIIDAAKKSSMSIYTGEGAERENIIDADIFITELERAVKGQDGDSITSHWYEPIIKKAMAHAQSKDEYHWTACICCGRALHDLAPALLAEHSKRIVDRLNELLKRQIPRDKDEEGFIFTWNKAIYAAVEAEKRV